MLGDIYQHVDATTGQATIWVHEGDQWDLALSGLNDKKLPHQACPHPDFPEYFLDEPDLRWRHFDKWSESRTYTSFLSPVLVLVTPSIGREKEGIEKQYVYSASRAPLKLIFFCSYSLARKGKRSAEEDAEGSSPIKRPRGRALARRG